MIVKKHATSEGKLILAICDDELLGKKFEEGNRQLDLTSSFYKGAKMDEREILKVLKETNVINAVGQNTLNFLEKNGFIIETALVVDKIPHAQIVVD